MLKEVPPWFWFVLSLGFGIGLVLLMEGRGLDDPQINPRHQDDDTEYIESMCEETFDIMIAGMEAEKVLKVDPDNEAAIKKMEKAKFDAVEHCKTCVGCRTVFWRTNEDWIAALTVHELREDRRKGRRKGATSLGSPSEYSSMSDKELKSLANRDQHAASGLSGVVIEQTLRQESELAKQELERRNARKR